MKNLKQHPSFKIILFALSFFVVAIILMVIAFNRGRNSQASLQQVGPNPNTEVSQQVSENVNPENPESPKNDPPQEVPKKKSKNKVDLRLTDKGFIEEDYQKKFTFDFKLNNNTDREIRGFSGELTFFDIFDDEITSTTLSYDEGMQIGEEKMWDAKAPYNQYLDDLVRLKNTPTKNLRTKWKLKEVIYADEYNAKVSQESKPKKVDLSIIKKDFKEVDYKNFITLKLNLTNNTQKNIKGVQGSIKLYDIFDDELYTISLAYDQQMIESGTSMEWDVLIDYNRFTEADVSLKGTELANMTYKWDMESIVYEDGEKETF